MCVTTSYKISEIVQIFTFSIFSSRKVGTIFFVGGGWEINNFKYFS